MALVAIRHPEKIELTKGALTATLKMFYRDDSVEVTTKPGQNPACYSIAEAKAAIAKAEAEGYEVKIIPAWVEEIV